MSKLKQYTVYLFNEGGTKVYLKRDVDRLLDQHGISRFTEIDDKTKHDKKPIIQVRKRRRFK